MRAIGIYELSNTQILGTSKTPYVCDVCKGWLNPGDMIVSIKEHYYAKRVFYHIKCFNRIKENK